MVKEKIAELDARGNQMMAMTTHDRPGMGPQEHPAPGVTR